VQLSRDHPFTTSLADIPEGPARIDTTPRPIHRCAASGAVQFAPKNHLLVGWLWVGNARLPIRRPTLARVAFFSRLAIPTPTPKPAAASGEGAPSAAASSAGSSPSPGYGRTRSFPTAAIRRSHAWPSPPPRWKFARSTCPSSSAGRDLAARHGQSIALSMHYTRTRHPRRGGAGSQNPENSY
jgi:hypothetical protein